MEGTVSEEQVSLVKQLLNRGASALGWGATATGHPEIGGAVAVVGKTTDTVIDATKLILSEKDRIQQLLQRHKATRQKRELQELILEPESKLTQAFSKTLNQWSAKHPILLILDTYEKSLADIDTWLGRGLLANADLTSHKIRLVTAGRHPLTTNENWRELKQDHNVLEEIQLECFNSSETEQYLQEIGITESNQVRIVYDRTNGLPYHLDWIREQYKRSSSLDYLQDIRKVVDLHLRGFNEIEKQVVKWTACGHWVSKPIVQHLIQHLQPEGKSETSVQWFDWLKHQHFIEYSPSRKHYRIKDVARDI